MASFTQNTMVALIETSTSISFTSHAPTNSKKEGEADKIIKNQ
jgi:hypothetical protein